MAVGIAPVVTYNHFTAPHWFAKRGGWLDPQAPGLFAWYCGFVAEHPLVKGVEQIRFYAEVSGVEVGTLIVAIGE